MFKNLAISSFLGLLAVFLGALGSHYLKTVLTIEQLESFQTAVQYQMYHALVLLFVNGATVFNDLQKNRITLLFVIGIVCFSGSIYVINVTTITAKSIWFITPLGGLFLILGWITMSYIFLKKMLNFRKK